MAADTSPATGRTDDAPTFLMTIGGAAYGVTPNGRLWFRSANDPFDEWRESAAGPGAKGTQLARAVQEHLARLQTGGRA